MKTVNYMGKDFEVPDWATHIAADPDGTVYAYTEEPFWDGGVYVGQPMLYVGSVIIVPEVVKIDL